MNTVDSDRFEPCLDGAFFKKKKKRKKKDGECNTMRTSSKQFRMHVFNELTGGRGPGEVEVDSVECESC